MSRILFAWELGTNFGHLMRDATVATRLRERGHEVIFAVRDVRIAEELLTPRGFAFLAAPRAVGLPKFTRQQISYADLLAANAFADERLLLGLVRSWSGLFELCRPDAVVIDHAPTALLAARTCEIPALIVGTGFDVPPLVSPLPPMQPWDEHSPEVIAATESPVVDNINAVLGALRKPAVRSVADLFATIPTFLATFPQLDHYGERANATYVGPLGAGSVGRAVSWPQGADARILAYLRPNLPRIEMMLSALSKSRAHVICAMPGAPSSLTRRFRTARMQVFDHAISIAPLLATASAMFSYGGAATIAGTLLAGVPLLICSLTVEQHLGGTRVETLGAGLIMRKQRTEIDFRRAIDSVVNDGNYRVRAQEFAAQHAHFTPESGLTRVVESIESTAGGWPAAATPLSGVSANPIGRS